MVNYNNLSESRNIIPMWDRDVKHKKQRLRCCLFSVLFAFVIGLSVGVFVPFLYKTEVHHEEMNATIIQSVFLNNSYSNQNGTIVHYPTVSFVDKDIEIGGVIVDGIYWGDGVERALPGGFNVGAHDNWSSYVKKGVAIKLEHGCGRMQNRLVTFQDGSQGCVRYRQNTDQIQGELFSFYLAQILKLPNLAPSTISVVNLETPLWQNLRNEIASAQWNSNRPIVLTQYIPNLDSSNIPNIFRPTERHLNKHDLQNLTTSNNTTMKLLIELAQWSDLIIFDYLTANLDRIVNNLYNYQWNTNIMEAPAHNLAKKVDSDLLIFLDNESGLLHGYRLLEKYEIYHTILLDNLCVFRRQTADVIKRLREAGNVGDLLRDMFERTNGKKVKDVLPTLPDKSVKILNARIDKVYNQIVKCEAMFGENST